MRKDMAKVIVERPRLGHKDSYKPLRASRKHDVSEDAPHGESMTKPHRMHYEGKRLNENLAPLKRFLAAQVGRPWDKVYSEINEHVKVTNAVQAHVREHIAGFVALKVHRDEFNQIWDTGRFWPMLLSKGDLYVDSDGIVKLFKKQPKLKYDPGCKVYAICKTRVGRIQKDSLSNHKYYNVRYSVVDTRQLEPLVAGSSIIRYFRAASLTEALKTLNKDYYSGNSSWGNREYV
jgi:hypothetical protein